MEEKGNIVNKLKKIINVNGPHFLGKNPYQTYTELMKDGTVDKKTAGAILCFLVNGLSKYLDSNNDITELTKIIQNECGFNEDISASISAIFVNLYSKENIKKWKSKEKEGLKQFLNDEFTYKWTGYTIWYVSNVSMDCHYQAEIVLSPTQDVIKDNELAQMLEANPFLKKKVIREYFEKKLENYLDDQFNEYCTCEEYYEPAVEDFYLDDCVEEWCKMNGFTPISCDGSGYDDGYEPN
jgi:hypothetical protein